MLASCGIVLFLEYADQISHNSMSQDKSKMHGLIRATATAGQLVHLVRGHKVDPVYGVIHQPPGALEI